MPQPLRPGQARKIDFSPNALLSNHRLASHMAIISNLWIQIEEELGNILAFMLGARGSIAAKMLYALGNLKARLDVIRVPAKQILPQELYLELVQTLFSAVNNASRRRANVIHKKWGVSPLYPDAVILCPIPWENGQHRPMKYNELDFFEIETALIRTIDRLVDFRLRMVRYLLSLEQEKSL